MTSTPYIFAGLAVALGFKCNLFNIGAEGQLYIGALASVWIGYTVTGLPFIIHMPLAFLGGALAAAVWGAIPGYLRARTGAHEVINTIMMNYIAFRLADWLVNGPMKRGGGLGYIPITPSIDGHRRDPQVLSRPHPLPRRLLHRAGCRPARLLVPLEDHAGL